MQERLTFFDAFCGSGSVSDYFKSYYDIIINDNLTWSVIYTKGRICAPICTFEKLGFDPFEYLNSNETIVQGFMYKNYAPTESARMYFIAILENRLKIGKMMVFFWKKNIVIC